MQSKKDKTASILEILKHLFSQTKPTLVYKDPWQLLVAVILSARNTDKKVNEVTKTLFNKYKTVEDYKNADLKKLEKDLATLGLFRQKAKFIKETATIIDGRYNGRIPDSMQELTKLPGIGRKTANIILGNLYNIVEGIAVDTHVTRLSRLFGLTKNTDPYKIEKDLMEILPKKEWFDFTNRMIDYGRTYCPALCKHTECPLKSYIIR